LGFFLCTMCYLTDKTVEKVIPDNDITRGWIKLYLCKNCKHRLGQIPGDVSFIEVYHMWEQSNYSDTMTLGDFLVRMFDLAP